MKEGARQRFDRARGVRHRLVGAAEQALVGATGLAMNRNRLSLPSEVAVADPVTVMYGRPSRPVNAPTSIGGVATC